MNTMAMMKLAASLAKFRSAHPKFAKFLVDVPRIALREGAVVEISITDVDGKTYSSNLRVTAEDIELYNDLKNMRGE